MPLAGLMVLLPTEALRTLAARDVALGFWQENGASAYLGHVLAAVKIFEQVPGARVEVHDAA